MIMGAAGCDLAGRSAYAEPAEYVDPRLVEANTGFAFDLFHALKEGAPSKNMFISPASVSLALAMTFNGAAGETAEAMGKVLHIEDMNLDEINSAFADLRTILQNPDPRVKLAIANSLWAREGVDFYEEFLRRNRDFFNAGVEALDFSSPGAARTINRWVEKQTGGQIKDLIEPPIDPLTVLFLINAIYLKAEWSKPFDTNQTRDIPFYLPDGSSKQRPVMFQEGEFQYLDGEGFQAVNIPYGKNGRIGMYIFLPDPDQSLEDFYRQLDSSAWSSWMGSFKQTEGTVGLPRFKYEYESSLNDVLKSLGMEIAFDSQAADFSAMRPTPPRLYIAEVKHKAFVEINEKGTEAAAATSVEMKCTSAAPTPDRFTMIIDRPFFFSIVDQKTCSILFMGSVTDPQQ
ncbi:MAG TPA: serpin family protein [Firmicutes bacterium]|nr:serpin family protein [Bacillota bacterium]